MVIFYKNLSYHLVEYKSFLETAKAIREMYYACGDLVDQDVVVGVTLRDIDTLWSETYK